MQPLISEGFSRHVGFWVRVLFDPGSSSSKGRLGAQCHDGMRGEQLSGEGRAAAGCPTLPLGDGHVGKTIPETIPIDTIPT